jgi:hypothetical protein
VSFKNSESASEVDGAELVLGSGLSSNGSLTSKKGKERKETIKRTQ